ncbi:hypothetical protein KKG46_05025 [Patescibacteria group bacterium]|nr:hypothetical protein [Patescibacteria group bacterium]
MSRFQIFKKTRQIRFAASKMQPDANWVASTRSTLLMQAKNNVPEIPSKKLHLAKSIKFFSPAISFSWMRTPAFAIVAILITVFSGSMFSVSAAEQSVPGDFLYSVKLATEQARMALTKGPEDRVKLKTEFTERRVQEMKQVIATPAPDRKERVTQAAEVLKRDLNTIKNQLDEVQQNSTPEQAKETARIVDEKTTSVVKDLQESKNQLSPEERVKVSEAQAAASDTSIRAIEVLVQAHEDDGDVVTDQDVVDVLKTHQEKVVQTVSESTGLDMSKMATSTPATNTTSTPATVTEGSSSTQDVLQKVSEANNTLNQVGQLAADKKMDEAVQMLKQGSQQAFAAQKTAEEAEVQKEQTASSEVKATSTDMGADMPTSTTEIETKSTSTPQTTTSTTNN